MAAVEITDEIQIYLQTLMEFAKSTFAIVSRIDDRARHSSRREAVPIVLQEACFRYWEAGRAKAEIRFGQSTKVTYKSVFDYFKRELNSLGVRDCGEFSKILRVRSKRISRSHL